MTDNNPQEILEFMDNYFSSWEKLEIETCTALWDSEYPSLTYQPSEYDEPMTDYDVIARYIGGNRLIDLKIFRPTTVNVIDFIRSDVVFVHTDLICKFEVPDNEFWRRAEARGSFQWPAGAVVNWKGKASLVLHKVDGDWKMIHYEDSTTWDCVNNNANEEVFLGLEAGNLDLRLG